MSVIPFPARLSTLDRFGQARRDMLCAFAGLVERGEHSRADLMDEVGATARALLTILQLMEPDHG